MVFISSWWSLRLLVILTCGIGSEAITCRYNTTSPHTIAYYTCSQLATKYGISVDTFVLLNPGVNAACTNLQPDTKYCVDGSRRFASSSKTTLTRRAVTTPTTLTGDCGPSSPNTTCKGYSGGGCCNSMTWRCENSTCVTAASFERFV
jgi:hypothetical protein